MTSDDRERAQRERALQAWELVVLETPRSAALEALRRVLGVKRFELPQLTASLPGVVRRGAQIDLAPLEGALRAAGIRCELRRSSR
ncbi:MAG: hypothetical protein JSU66_03170 [Deltaproteobacteria bacterium]|nr:MAG: hypothetical protein JSU66_03170 [Deltaproteobacteria bacterium]